MILARATAVFAIVMAWIATAGAAHAASDPTNVRVIPVFGQTTKWLRVTWTPSGTPSGFQLQRRPVGGTFSNLVSPAGGTDLFDDHSTNETHKWEYRIRALDAAGPSNWIVANVSPDGSIVGMSTKQVWPISKPVPGPDWTQSHNVLHNFGTPIKYAGNAYCHAAIDITTHGHTFPPDIDTGAVLSANVVASRGGVVEAVVPASDLETGGQVVIKVTTGGTDVLGNPVYELIDYGHVTPEVAAGELVGPGDLIGTVRFDHFTVFSDPAVHHMHWGTPNRNCLATMPQVGDRDPADDEPKVTNVNPSYDSTDFLVVNAHAVAQHTAVRKYAYGDVDFLVDACDDMMDGDTLVQAPYSIGYWISDLANNPVVRSPSAPYVLIRFQDALPGVSSGHASANAVYWSLPADIGGRSTWQTFLTWRLTDAGGPTGFATAIDAGQFWRTDAKRTPNPLPVGLRPNGSNQTAIAGDVLEAWWPDRFYKVHIVLTDHLHEKTFVRGVRVSNFRPYLQHLAIWSGPNPIYQTQWRWLRGPRRRVCVPPRLKDALLGKATRDKTLVIQATFTEPMRTPPVIDVLGMSRQMWSVGESRTRWVFRIQPPTLRAADPAEKFYPIAIMGLDATGTWLRRVEDRSPRPAGHGKRLANGLFPGADGPDKIHGFVLAKGARGVGSLFDPFWWP